MAKKSAKKAAKQKRQAQNQARSRANNNSNKNANNTNQNNNTNSNTNSSKHIQQLTSKMANFSLADDNNGGGGQLPALSLVPSGLGNLGSTCYFNSVMQVLGQTYVLGRQLAERSDPQYTWEAKTVYLEVVSASKKEEEEEGEDIEGKDKSGNGNGAEEEEEVNSNTSSSIEAYFRADSRRTTLPEPHSLITAFVNLQREIFTGR